MRKLSFFSFFLYGFTCLFGQTDASLSEFNQSKIELINLLQEKIDLKIVDSLYYQGNYKVAVKSTFNPNEPGKEFRTESIEGFENKRAMVLHLSFDSGKGDIDFYAEELLIETFKQLLEEDADQLDKIAIFGHTDFERTAGVSNFDKDSVCYAAGVGVSTNHCLGLARAQLVYALLEDFLVANSRFDLLEKVQTPVYHDHFFLGYCNHILNNELLNIINSSDEALQLRTHLGLESNLSPEDIRSLRSNDFIYENFLFVIKQARKNFEPFRSVVIINYYKT